MLVITARRESRWKWKVRPGRTLWRYALFACAVATSLALPANLATADDLAGMPADPTQPVTITAEWSCRWQQGIYDVWHLRGNCSVHQGTTHARGPEAIIWVDNSQGPGQPTKLIVYIESAQGQLVEVDYQQAARGNHSVQKLGRQQAPNWFHRFYTITSPQFRVPPAAAEPAVRPPIYDRGLAQFDPQRRKQLMLAQYTEFAPAPLGSQPLPPGMRKFQAFGRNDSEPNINSRVLPSGERVFVISGGIRLLVEGLPVGDIPAALGPLGTVDITTDRAVIWTAADRGGLSTEFVQSQDTPLEIYMEGNIEFRLGDRVIYADRMFYDVRRQIGVILNAELLTPLPKYKDFEYQGLVRLKASAIRQLDQSHFSAINALVTTSRLEKPAYHFAANEIAFEDIQRQGIDPRTGQLVANHQQLAESRGNFVYLRGLPVFYWPTIATDLSKPSFFIDRIRVGRDDIYGTQVMADLDAYQLFGIRNPPPGTELGISLDYLSERGLGHGAHFEYDRTDAFGYQGPAEGLWDFWGISDDGLDFLGRGRQGIVPEEDYRFRLFGRHRQQFDNGWELTGEVGWLSDRTFLEQYYEQEWDEYKDPRTGLRLKRLTDNRAFSIEANGQVNEFFTETQWLPRLDHYWLGESLFGDRFTWFEHSQAAYANAHVADPPTNPDLADVWTVLPWEADVEGERLVTRQELDLPLQLGPVKVVPFALGELAHWGQDINGDEIQRAYIHTGVRASVPFWATFPDVRDTLFNLNGLAHKVVFDAEFAYADADENLDDFMLYDPLDDISIIEYRRRLLDGTLDPTVPLADGRFDPRFYAFRSGLQGWVTSPSTEIADDLMALRTGMRHRWQTKRGGPGRQHIVDWLTLDTNVTYFPKADRDNFGEELGLFDYDMRWFLGDRFTIVSDGAADFFGDGLRTISGGVLINRPTRGNGYIGFRSIDGPIQSSALTGSYSYRLSPKWISTASASYDFSDGGNIGQTFSMTRIGESMLVTVGFNVDEAKDNVGVRFMIEPRFLPKLRLTSQTGIEVPPAGAFGLE